MLENVLYKWLHDCIQPSNLSGALIVVNNGLSLSASNSCTLQKVAFSGTLLPEKIMLAG